ncbi:hypothetical protein Aph01nite_70760 [Acrocarpospora phusangensis]|uniref:Condensation domain-containing protein n=1 Tax=Acrocarpospora phusangensis TaxID=1070424 RepID=A0A919QH94_9ACTN|nr:condensation domain-containing protein [Acrocarpospora phusangensis]GIH28766.1 hypothetical protein Aph01nite_70760 [Acrocarpospora phusangensis]
MPTGDLLGRLIALEPAARREFLRRTQDGDRESGVPARPRPSRFPAFPAQQSQWFLWRMAPADPAYHVPACYDIRGPLRVDVLAEAVAALVARHEILRTGFDVAGSELQQVVHERMRVPVEMSRVSGRNQALPAAESAVEEAFDLLRGPLLRVRVWQYGPQRFLLLTVFHHIVIDERGSEIFEAELGELYRAAVQDRSAALAPLAAQCGDLALRHSAHDRDTGIAYWREHLTGSVPTSLPGDRPARPAERLPGAVVLHPLPPGSGQRTADLAAELGVTPFAVVAAAFADYLARFAGDSDVVFGTPVSCREEPGADALVGYFLNTLALRLPVPPGGGFAELAVEAQRVITRGLRHRHVAFADIVEATGRIAGPFRNPLFDVLLVYLQGESADRCLRLTDDVVVARHVLPPRSAFPYLAFMVLHQGQDLTLLVRYPVDHYDDATVRRHAADLADAFHHKLIGR